jgi:glycerol-3-phosphate cytidylyltransferase
MSRIGYTTGVFDLFHIGHLNILRRSRAECDELIVGVSTDELVLATKGRLPAVPFDERLEIVSAIRDVDRAVPQASLDKLEAWSRLRFDVLFSGSDHQSEPRWQEYERRLAEKGSSVTYFPYTTHTSSSLVAAALTNLVAGDSQ